jgi:predicted transcriptional regulator YheO
MVLHVFNNYAILFVYFNKEYAKLKKENNVISVKLNDSDKEVLNALRVVVEGIARFFGKNCEVALHSLEDIRHSIIEIANGHVTGRNIGSPLTDFAMELLKKADFTGKDVTDNYYTRLEDGRILRSVTMLIKNNEGKPIGLLCINVDLSAPLIEVISEFLSHDGRFPPERTVEHFSSNVEDLIHTTLQVVTDDVNNRSGIPLSDRGKVIVAELYTRGIFNIKGALDLVAKEIGVSRYTVYNYIREAKMEIREP